jgi:hypothetical protein
MPGHQYNVYETLEKIHALTGTTNEVEHQPTDMDTAELHVLVSQLANGTSELLHHLARHEILVADTDDAYTTITPDDICELAAGKDDGFSEMRVAITVPPPDLVAQLSEIVGPTTIAESAELLVLMHLQHQLTTATKLSAETIHASRAPIAARALERALPLLHQLHAAGLLTVVDSRTGETYELDVVGSDEANQHIKIEITSHPDNVLLPQQQSKSRPAPLKSATRKPRL